MFGRSRSFWVVLCILAVSISAFLTVGGNAEDSVGNSRTLMQAYIDKQYLDLFVSGDFDPPALNVKAANKAAAVTESGSLSEADVTVRTTVLIDISTSMPSTVRDKIYEFLEYEIKNLPKNEELKIVTFGEQISVLTDFISDRYDLSNTVKEIEFDQTQSAVYDAIYNTMPTPGAESGKPCFYHTVVITDGADRTAQGITKEELYMRLRDETYPVDVIGVSKAVPENQNKELLALSRISNGRYMDLYPETDIEKCALELSTSDFFWIRAEIPIELLDGSTRQIDVSDGTSSLTFDLKLSAVNAPAEDTSKDESGQQTDKGGFVLNSTTMIIVGIAAGAVILITVIVLLIVNAAKKKSNIPPQRNVQIVDTDDGVGETEFYNEQTDERYTVKLSVQNDPSQCWTLTIAGEVLIGRAENCTVKLTDKSVSREQCKIAAEGIGLVVINLSESNATKLNGAKVNGKPALRSGDVIKFGRVSLRVDFIQKIGAELPVSPEPPSVSDNDNGNTQSIF